MMRILLAVAVAYMLPMLHVFAKEIRDPGDQADQDEVLIHKILDGDTSAIRDAGRTGKTLFIPYLRRELNDRTRRGADVSPAEAAELSLAQLGDAKQLQECWCRMATEDPQVGIYPPLEELMSVRGWFSIRALEIFLSPQGLTHWQRALAKHTNKHPEDRDVMVAETPTTQALRLLPRVVDNPPVQFTRENSVEGWNKQIHIWQDWIAAHKEELSKLQPTGEGVDFSPNACKNGKPRKRR